MAPKLRGGRRHYAQLHRDAERLVARVNAGESFDMWHHHFDYRGFGNGREATRHRHLTVLFRAFDAIIQTERAAAGEVQVFASVGPPNHSASDALYLHSRCMDAPSFPYRYTGVEWCANAPPALAPFMQRRPWRVGRLLDGSRLWWVVAPSTDPGFR